jgi:stress response protein SCP2
MIPPLSMTPGANVVLTPLLGDTARVQAVLSWREGSEHADADVSALLLTKDGRVRYDEDLIFYNQPGSVRHVGKTTTDTAVEDRVDIDLATVAGEVHRIIIAASLDAGPVVGFGVLDDLTLTLSTQDSGPVLVFPNLGASTETAFLFGELYRRAGEWKFRAVGQGYDTGLAGLATDFGIDVDDQPDPADAPVLTGEPDRDQTQPASTAAKIGVCPHEEAVNDVPQGAIDPVSPQAVVPDNVRLLRTPAANAVAEVSAHKPRRTAVTTRKKKVTQQAPPVLALAGDETWQSARLFSIAGIGGADEQEKRATSALMAIVMAVRSFGRVMTGRLGAPAGTVETFLEVAFPLGERKVIPDAVIRVARGGSVWTCLVETKTGSGRLRREQVENYLDVAKDNGFDAVLTLSNDLAPSAGTHPLTIDKRRLRKVALYHLSWLEVLHEARMQIQHRGVDDQQQAWMLRELIRYLEHPRSGVGGFDDMGAVWVPVRDAVAASTLRATDKRASEVGEAWDKLVRHLCLRLTGSLGVDVRPVLPRTVVTDPQTRLAATMTQLVETGEFHASIKVPDAVGVLRVVANLRTGQVELAMQVDAPREGRPQTRVNWLLRQLKEAPDAVRVECLMARRTDTTCELLRDLRVVPGALLPDPAVDVRAFRLSASSPLGGKRGVGRGAFITSVETAVDGFYTDVEQSLKRWTPTAPKMTSDMASEAYDADATITDDTTATA